MNTVDRIALTFVVCAVLLGCLIAFAGEGGCGRKKCYTIEIEFTDGTKRTVQFESIERPKVTDEGCMYDHSKKSWICGCRDIQYKECSK